MALFRFSFAKNLDKRIRKFIYKNIKSIFLAIIVIALFIFTSWLSHNYSTELASSAFSDNVYGEFLYFLISVFSVVIAGISASPLIPLANVIWGPAITLTLTAIGWTIGSMIAFWLSRRFGEKLVCRIVNKCDFEDYRNNIGTKNLFWQLLLARIFLPVDVLSYVIGLFTKMNWFLFFLSTLIGSFLFTILAIVASSFDVVYQIIFGIIFLIIFFYRLQKLIKSVIVKKI
jgi:uncharacterized membrane protein YdjX (TVP38/TMEM64 family)